MAALRVDVSARRDKPAAVEKVCRGCGQAFSRGVTDGHSGCWCESLPPLAAPCEGDCYCPRCLEAKVAARRRPSAP